MAAPTTTYYDSRRGGERIAAAESRTRCPDCGLEPWFTEECSISGLRHPGAPRLPLSSYEDFCDDCNGISQLTERVHRHKILQQVGRMQHVQREMFNLTNQPPRLGHAASRNDATWPAIARLEREKTQLVAIAHDLGIDAAPVHPVPRDVHEAACPRGDAEALVRYNARLKEVLTKRNPELVDAAAAQPTLSM
eukprot:TRINITY_DN27632_c0_g1_i1.p1 TRINITY_DN27632_c0_g1~~TRINITY_DN27632_c0_g1_i1.p1  ORF type:complete len:213 (+),score=60.67 TRINITY_DN27632_c0_g1_i1:62-640(+)